MHFGHIISGTLHFIFLLWLVMGDVFSSNFEPPDYDYIEITGATEEEWKATELKHEQREYGTQQKDIVCPICCENLGVQDQVILCCSHVFHKSSPRRSHGFPTSSKILSYG